MVTIASSAPHHHEEKLDDMLCLISEPASLWVIASYREALLTWLCDHKPINPGKSPLTLLERSYHLTTQELFQMLSESNVKIVTYFVYGLQMSVEDPALFAILNTVCFITLLNIYLLYYLGKSWC